MRKLVLVWVGAVCVCACDGGRRDHGSAAVAGFPARRAGLWRETIVRDGHPGPIGGALQMCVDAATDTRMMVFGRRLGHSACPHPAVRRDADGAYRFTAACVLGLMGRITSSGTARGDFSRHYVLHGESQISGSSIGPMNGRHVTDLEATWVGPCPAGMSPGDVELGGGVRVNIDRLPAAFAGGP